MNNERPSSFSGVRLHARAANSLGHRVGIAWRGNRSGAEMGAERPTQVAGGHARRLRDIT